MACLSAATQLPGLSSQGLFCAAQIRVMFSSGADYFTIFYNIVTVKAGHRLVDGASCLCFCHLIGARTQQQLGFIRAQRCGGHHAAGPVQGSAGPGSWLGQFPKGWRVLFSQTGIPRHCGSLAGQRADTGLDTAWRDCAQTLEIEIVICLLASCWQKLYPPLF